MFNDIRHEQSENECNIERTDQQMIYTKTTLQLLSYINISESQILAYYHKKTQSSLSSFILE